MESSNRLMTSADVARLPLNKIATALHQTTEVLAAELAAPTSTAPDWTEFEWCIARAVAAMHGVSPLLASTLRWRGPESWERFLREQREHTLQRHQRIAQLLEDIGSRAVRDGIAMVALKGAALHEVGCYQPGERPMADIDLLVKDADREPTAQLLGACGYKETFSTWKHWVFEPEAGISTEGFGEHARNPLKIELHTKIVERFPSIDRDISDLIFTAQPTAGLNSYPSIAALMLHVLTHAAGAMCVNNLRLLHLHDIAVLSRRMTSSDWDAVFASGIGQASWWISPPLTLTARYFSAAIPAHIVARAEADCSWLLRRICRRRTLSDVSLSSLWIRAFPGVEWSRSTLEAYRYVASRINPDREYVGARMEAMRTHPSLALFTWSHLPQWQRIVRWVFRRPPRLDTMSSVCAALGSQVGELAI